MITGGLAGFLIGMAFGLAQQSAWPTVLLRASVSTLCAGLLFRWWAGIWIRSIQEAFQEPNPADPGRPARQVAGAQLKP